MSKNWTNKIVYWLLSLSSLIGTAYGSTDREDLLADSFIYEDKGAQLSITELMELDRQGKMTKFQPKLHSSFGFTNSIIWVKTTISNESLNTIQKYIGTIRPEYSMINLYEVKNGVVHRAFAGGADHDIESRVITSRLHVFPTKIAPKSKTVFYFQIASRLGLSMVLNSFSDTSFRQAELKGNTIHFLYVGMLSSLIIYSLFLYTSLRDHDFLLYSAFGLVMAFSDLLYSGFFEYWDVTLPIFRSHDMAISLIGISSLLVLIYTRSLLKVQEFSPRLAKSAIWMATGIGIAVAISLFYQNPLLNLIIQGSQALTIVYVLTTGILAYRNHQVSAIVYLCGWGIFSITVVIWLLGNEGIIEKSFWIAYAPLIGNTFEMVFTAIAQSLKFNRMREHEHERNLARTESESLRTLVQVVCHDIANPLSVIMGSHMIASKSKDPEKVARSMQRIDRAGASIEAIINQVRRMQAIQSGKQDLKLVPTSIKKVFDECQFTLEERAKRKGVQLSFAVDEKIEVLADEVILAHDVICNFISNAIKFSDKGKEVTVACEESVDSINITISDQGIGMPQELIDKLFSKNANTSRKGTGSEAGTGFGMPLAKYFLDTFGATIEVKSREKSDQHQDHGTCFTLSFPKPPIAEKAS